MQRSRHGAGAVFAVFMVACGGAASTPDAGPAPTDGGRADAPTATAALRITELCADDDGFLIDELGQTEDWIEIANVGDSPIDLSNFALAAGASKPHVLPRRTLAAGELLVFFADDEAEQGELHLGFRLAAGGEAVKLTTRAGLPVDTVVYPALVTNQVYARFPHRDGGFAKCRYASPGRPNGERCGPPPPPGLPKDIEFRPYTWPPIWPQLPSPVAITEAALRPARFIEIANTGAVAIALADFSVRVAEHAPGQPWPGAAAGRDIAAGRSGSLAPGERAMIPVSEADVAAILDPALRPEGEGVVTVFRRSNGTLVDRLDFMRWPEGAALARFPDSATTPGSRFRYCANATPGQPNATCTQVSERDVGDRLRRLAAAGDDRRLAEGGTELDTESVKFVVEMQPDGDVVHFLASRTWALHYTFIRERVYQQPKLDRCSPADAAVFDAGWREFSEREYFKLDGRRFLLGTLVKYGGSGLNTVEFARGDVISGALMRRAFLAVMTRVEDPARWAVRPQDADQVAQIRSVEGTLPAVDPNAPFRGLTYQPVNAAVGYGVLRFVASAELQTAALGPDVIMVTDDVPNDIPLVGGLVTEAFQTPLSHVGVLSRNRGTPNMAVVEARKDPRIAPFFEKLIRLEVSGAGFSVREADPAEARAFWDKRRPKGPRLSPRLDTSVRSLVDLVGQGLDSLPVIGAKAAQLAELLQVQSVNPDCAGPVPAPADAFAVPLVHSLEHFAQSGGAALLAELRARVDFSADPRVRAQGLARVREAIVKHPVAPALVKSIEDLARARFGTRRFRLRSSSNTEDLPGFTGAGLYTSVSAAVDDKDRTVADGLREVWASLWAERAYDERELALIDHDRAAMGILVHEAFAKVERANGVAASRNLQDPTQSDVFTINAQAGEASVTNPAPGVTSDQMLYTWYLKPPIEYKARSSLVRTPVLKLPEVERLACVLRAIRDHFQPRIDPMGKNRWFTMEVEFKFVGEEHRLVIKQARPYSFGGAVIPADCREI